MTLVTTRLLVPAAAEQVFDFVALPKNFTRMWPAMSAVFGEAPSPRGGLDWRWQYRMLGLKLEGQTVVIEHDRPARIAMLSQGGGLSVAHAWSFAPVAGGTELRLAMEFTLPAQWLTGFMEPMLARENRQQVAIALTNLRKALAE